MRTVLTAAPTVATQHRHPLSREMLLHRSTILVALALSLFAWSGSAFALFGNGETRAEVKQLRQQVKANEKSVDARLTKLETDSVSRGAVLDLSGQIQSLQSAIADLRGQLEVIDHRILTDEKRQRELYLDIDTRLRKLEQSGTQAAGTSQAGSAVGKAQPKEGTLTPAETQAYEMALNQFRLAKYALALASFQKFISAYPSSSLAASAQYWIGNTYFAQGKYKEAIAAQRKLLTSWPKSSKTPDAMLNIASSQDALGDAAAAHRTLELLISKYPHSAAAGAARQRLGSGAKH